MKTENRRKIWPVFMILVFMLACLPLSAQIEVDAYVDRNRVAEGEQIRFSLEISGPDASGVARPGLPDIDGFDISGPSQSSRQEISIINGRTTANTRVTYTWGLFPEREGTFTIPSLAIVHDGKTYRTRKINIQVSGKAQVPNSGSRTRRFERSQPRRQTSGNLEDNVFILATINKRSAYQGEPVRVLYELYIRDGMNVHNLSFDNEPEFDGFWKEDLFIADKINFRSETFDGRRFRVMKLRELLLTPSRTGLLDIDQLRMKVVVLIPSRDFFSFDQPREYRISSNKLRLEVKDLPLEGRPGDFLGGIGSFSIETSISDTVLTAGDSFTLFVKLSGTGNLNQLLLPELPEVENVRFMEPEFSSDVSKGYRGVRGSRTASYPGIAQQKGEVTIPPVKYTYFDTENEKYVTVRSQPIRINVRPGSIRERLPGMKKSRIIAQAQDIAYLRTGAGIQSWQPLAGTWKYWLIWLAIALSVPVTYLFAREREKEETDLDYYREKRARRILKKYLRSAAELAGRSDPDFYGAAHNGMLQYLADRLKISRASDLRTILDTMAQAGYSESLVTALREFMEKCDRSRFMPGGFSKEDVQRDFMELKRLLSIISRTRGRVSGTKTSTVSFLLVFLMIFSGLAAQDSLAVHEGNPDSETLWNQAVASYQDEDFIAAVRGFSQLERSGVQNVQLLYNLGNCWYRLGYTGRAIFYYEKVLKIDPLHSDALGNLSLIYETTGDREQSARIENLRTSRMQRFLRSLSLDVLSWLALGLFFLLVVMIHLLLTVYRKRDRTIPIFFGGLFLALLVIVILGGLYEWNHLRQVDFAVVLVPETYAFSGPGTEHTSLFRLEEGHIVQYVGQNEGWIRVRVEILDEDENPESMTGWIESSAAALIGMETGCLLDEMDAFVVAGSVPLYSSPDESRTELADLRYQQLVRVVEEKDGWTRVALRNGLTGWVHSIALDTEES